MFTTFYVEQQLHLMQRSPCRRQNGKENLMIDKKMNGKKKERKKTWKEKRKKTG